MKHEILSPMKSFVLHALMLLGLFAGGSVKALEMVGAPEAQVTGSTAVIRWTTNTESGSRVRYGTKADMLTQRAESEGVGVRHEVKLEGLQPGTTYFFSVGSARKLLANGSFQTPGKANDANLTKKNETQKPENKTVKRTAPPTRKIWGNMSTLQDHFDRHGADFKAKNPDDYARMSWEFLQMAMDKNLPAKLDDSDGTLRVWDGETRAFAAYNKDGTTKTFFKPGSADYFQRQPGRSVKLKRKD